MKTKTFRFTDVKLSEGRFIHDGFNMGSPRCEITLQVLGLDSAEKIQKLQKWMQANQLDYTWNIEQDFEKGILKVDFYKESGIVGKN